ncbi:hypothetical protein [Ramlibacter pallidus]|uniref:Uncharacterized protein n=1 Tax=Ramlibacter pallidus TaxID=2780087 RepID=A0ABR9SAP4_9BURK|nr:hypothetical protein [Ramlibacter pallidus]MBE7370037.1 hypothetical protein [Ramlibacter pallidus]
MDAKAIAKTIMLPSNFTDPETRGAKNRTMVHTKAAMPKATASEEAAAAMLRIHSGMSSAIQRGNSAYFSPLLVVPGIGEEADNAGV